jgi:hypothetical protein
MHIGISEFVEITSIALVGLEFSKSAKAEPYFSTATTLIASSSDGTMMSATGG